MRYVELPPPEPLAPVVECVWFLDGGEAAVEPPAERIVPDGCAEIIVQLGDAFRQLDSVGCEARLQPRAFLVGVLSRYWLVQPTGSVRTMGIRLRPGGVGALFGGRAHELADRATPLDEILGAAAAELEDRLRSAPDDGARARVAAGFVAGMMARASRPDLAVAAAVGAVMRTRGRARLRDLARASALSPRQLQRRFREAVGVGPKTLGRIARFQDLMSRLREGGASRWTDLALAAGFYDQAHLVRDFHAFTGQSPSRFVADEGMLSRCFASPDRIAQLLEA